MEKIWEALSKGSKIGGRGTAIRTLTLADRAKELSQSISVPTAEDWGVRGVTKAKVDALVSQLNSSLSEALCKLRRQDLTTLREVEAFLYSTIGVLAISHPNAGIMDTQAANCMARFFALNGEPDVYAMVRYRGLRGGA
jgi:hypothetical protein